jgi:sugar phosphate isomerase/epimerase
MKITFPSAVCADLDFGKAAELAARVGFDGVELHALADPSVASASNALLSSPEKIISAFAESNVAISSLNAGTIKEELADRIALASALGCPTVRFQRRELFSRNLAVSSRAVDWIRESANVAAAAHVVLLIENQKTAGSAIAMWHLLDRINHPAVACCWNTNNAAVAGDLAAVAVPTLNSRIHAVVVGDLINDGPTREVRKTLERLRGIGFDHELIVRPSTGSTINELEQTLAKSIEILRDWKIAPASMMDPRRATNPASI